MLARLEAGRNPSRKHYLLPIGPGTGTFPNPAMEDRSRALGARGKLVLSEASE